MRPVQGDRSDTAPVGKKQKAREAAKELEFVVKTRLNAEEAWEVLQACSAAAATGGLKGSMELVAHGMGDGAFASRWEHKGPGGLITVTTYTVTFVPRDEKPSGLVLELEQYKYQGGGIGRPARLNSAPAIKKLESMLRAQLA